MGFRSGFYRFTAAYFLLTSSTGILLYFRSGKGRPGLFSDEVKEWLVMLHNGEWVTFVLLGRPFLSGIIIGSALSFALIRFSAPRIFKKACPPHVDAART